VIHRIVWPITALLGVIVLAIGINNVVGQRPPGLGGYSPYPPPVGRFVVAHANENRIIILDTGTGKLYKATENDFGKMSDLPRFATPTPMTYPPDRGPRFKDKPDFPTKDKDRPGRDRFTDKKKE
jgi:hypothetical protein